jgi:hypothetical protein
LFLVVVAVDSTWVVVEAVVVLELMDILLLKVVEELV